MDIDARFKSGRSCYWYSKHIYVYCDWNEYSMHFIWLEESANQKWNYLYTFRIKGLNYIRNSYFNQFIRIFSFAWWEFMDAIINFWSKLAVKLTLYHSSHFNEGVKLDSNSKYQQSWQGEKRSWGIFHNSQTCT